MVVFHLVRTILKVFQDQFYLQNKHHKDNISTKNKHQVREGMLQNSLDVLVLKEKLTSFSVSSSSLQVIHKYYNVTSIDIITNLEIDIWTLSFSLILRWVKQGEVFPMKSLIGIITIHFSIIRKSPKQSCLWYLVGDHNINPIYITIVMIFTSKGFSHIINE